MALTSTAKFSLE